MQCWLNLKYSLLYATSPYQNCACLYSDNDIARRMTGLNFGQVTDYVTLSDMSPKAVQEST